MNEDDFNEARKWAKSDLLINMKAIKLYPQLVAEIKRLQSQVENCRCAKNLHVRRAEKLQDELARWQQIAIEATSLKNLYLDMLGDPDIDYELSKDENYIANYTKSHMDAAVEHATKELQLEATNEASYLARLEESFLEMYPLYTGATDYQAQAALVKIREGR